MLKPRHRAVIDALLPGLDARFDAFYADFSASAPLPPRLGFLAALEAAYFVSPLLIGRLSTFGGLSAEERVRALEALGKSGVYLLRQQLLLLKSIVSMHQGALPETRAALGMTQ